MAARATRSASRKSRLTEAVATGPLGALSHDELGVIFDGLAEPLQPVVAVALSSTCLGLRTPLQEGLEVLQQRHAKVKALCRKFRLNCTELCDQKQLIITGAVTAADMATLSVILQRPSGLPRLQSLLVMSGGIFGDAGMKSLCEGLVHGGTPGLKNLNLNHNNIGTEGAEAFAATLGRGSLPQLGVLRLGHNPIGDAGVAALATPLRKLPRLHALSLWQCGISDHGLGSLLAHSGKNDFKTLDELELHCGNRFSDAGCASLVSALERGSMPRLGRLVLPPDAGGVEARAAVAAALGRPLDAMWD